MSASDICNVPMVVNSVRWEAASDGFVPIGAVCGGKTFAGELVYIGRTKLKENRDELTPGVLIPSEGCLVVSFGTGVRTSTDYEVLITSDSGFIHWVSCRTGQASSFSALHTLYSIKHIDSSVHQVPANAVIGGIDCSYLEPLYIGKTRGDLMLGRTWRGQRFPSTISGVKCSVSSSSDTRSSDNNSEASSDTQRKSNAVLYRRTQDADEVEVKVGFPGKVHRSHKCLYIPYGDKEYIFRNYEVLTLTTSPAALSIITKCSVRDRILKIIRDERPETSRLRSGSTSAIAESEDLIELEDRIDSLPLPSKLKQFCKQVVK